MSEETIEIKSVKKVYKCPKCKTGYLEYEELEGVRLMSNPPQYSHKCNNDQCNHREYIEGKKYPYFEGIEQPSQPVINIPPSTPDIDLLNPFKQPYRTPAPFDDGYVDFPKNPIFYD